MEIPLWFINVFGVYIIASTCGFVWWMATITEKVSNVVRMIEEINKSGFATKAEVSEKIVPIAQSVQKAHERIDHMQEKR